MKFRILFLFSALVLTSCLEFKNSVFDTNTSIQGQWNSKFSVPSYNLAGGDIARFGIFSDSHQNYSDLSKTLRHMDQMQVDFAVFTGDATDFGSRDEFEIFHAFLKDAPYPTYIVPGNHDLTTTGRALFKKIYGPENREINTSIGKMIFFSNNPLEVLPERLNYDFLSNAVTSANPAEPLFIFQHQDPQNQLGFTTADRMLYDSTLTSFAGSVYVFHGHLHSFNKTQIGANTEVFQVSRVEKERWTMVEVDSSEVRVFQCQRKNCLKVFP